MDKYIKKDYEYDKNIPFKYQIDDYITYIPWTRPSKKRLLLILNDFHEKFSSFDVYLTGHYISNEPDNTWDIDIIITYIDISKKNYEEIYDAMFFLTTTGLENRLLLDIFYSDKIIHPSIFPDDMINMDKKTALEKIKDIKLSDGEQILIFKKLLKNKKGDSFLYELNDEIIKKTISINDKKLYFLDIEKLSYEKLYNKFCKNYKNGCRYYGIKKVLYE